MGSTDPGQCRQTHAKAVNDEVLGADCCPATGMVDVGGHAYVRQPRLGRNKRH